MPECGTALGRAASNHDAKVVITDGVAMTLILSDQLNSDSDMSDAEPPPAVGSTTALESFLRSSATSLRSVPSSIASTIYANRYTFWFLAFLVLTITLGGALVMNPASATNVGAFHPSADMVPSATVNPPLDTMTPSPSFASLTRARPRSQSPSSSACWTKSTSLTSCRVISHTKMVQPNLRDRSLSARLSRKTLMTAPRNLLRTNSTY